MSMIVCQVQMASSVSANVAFRAIYVTPTNFLCRFLHCLASLT